MPTPFVSKMAKKHHTTVDKAEDKWAEAKKLAGDQGHSGDYGYVTEIFKRKMGEKKTASSVAELSADILYLIKYLGGRYARRGSLSDLASFIDRFGDTTEGNPQALTCLHLAAQAIHFVDSTGRANDHDRVLLKLSGAAAVRVLLHVAVHAGTGSVQDHIDAFRSVPLPSSAQRSSLQGVTRVMSTFRQAMR